MKQQQVGQGRILTQVYRGEITVMATGRRFIVYSKYGIGARNNEEELC